MLRGGLGYIYIYARRAGMQRGLCYMYWRRGRGSSRVGIVRCRRSLVASTSLDDTNIFCSAESPRGAIHTGPINIGIDLCRQGTCWCCELLNTQTTGGPSCSDVYRRVSEAPLPLSMPCLAGQVLVVPPAAPPAPPVLSDRLPPVL